MRVVGSLVLVGNNGIHFFPESGIHFGGLGNQLILSGNPFLESEIHLFGIGNPFFGIGNPFCSNRESMFLESGIH